MGSGGGGTGREVSLLTVSLFSEEYHHSRNFRRKILIGVRLAASLCRREAVAIGESDMARSSTLCRDNTTPVYSTNGVHLVMNQSKEILGYAL